MICSFNHTKSSLKKITKADLIDGYLQRQGYWNGLEKSVGELEVELDEARTEVAKLIGKHMTKDEEIKKLKELTDGIMEEEGTGHILGCNAYEKFCQAMCELNYDEKWISELKEEIKKLKEENKELKLERQRDTIAEVRSARDRAMRENKILKAKFQKFKEVLTQE